MQLTNNEAENYKQLKRNRRDINVIKVPKNTGLNHYLAICKISFHLVNNGSKIVTEAEFTNDKARADIFDLTRGVCYEVLSSEKISNIELKKQYYPFPIYPVVAKDILECDDITKML